MSLLRRLLGPAVFHGRIKARKWRAKSRLRLEDAAVRTAPHLYREADRLATLPFRGSRLPRLAPELLADLAAYTELPPAALEELVGRRQPVDFRAEWHGTPPELRSDHWFYLSSKMYLFGNAIHFADDAEVDAVAGLLPDEAAVLEFGAGAGNLALGLARRGHTVAAEELSALQRDFLRFRIHRHGLAGRVSVVEPWDTPSPATVDAITSFDVLEHLPDGRTTLDERLLPVLRPGGILIENSPFVLNVSNPMHHEDWGLDEHLRSRGLTLEHTTRDGTRVWRSAHG